MLTIRAEQMRVLAAPSLARFEERMVRHVNRHFAEACARMGPDEVRDVVAYGCDRALDHGFATEKDLMRYLNLMFTFGPTFDRHPDHAWAAAILSDAGPDRMARLYARAVQEEGRGHRPDASAPAG